MIKVRAVVEDDADRMLIRMLLSNDPEIKVTGEALFGRLLPTVRGLLGAQPSS